MEAKQPAASITSITQAMLLPLGIATIVQYNVRAAGLGESGV